MNLHDEAVHFVRENNCACHTPVELIERAMIVGAIMAAKRINLKLSEASNELDKKRKESRPHNHFHKPLSLE